MYFFLLPLLLGFASNLASAFTLAFSRRWGVQRGSVVTFLLRNILGIPVWAAGFVLAARAPSPVLFIPPPVILVLGWLLITAGGVVVLLALITIRMRSAAPSTRDNLAQDGLYARVRHPIHSGTILELAGLFLILPTQTVTVACVLCFGWVLLQTRCEEIDLLQRLPGYRDYMDRVPRFLPRLKPR